MKKITAIVVGYGHRGNVYARYALENPEELQIVAVAEVSEGKRATAQRLFDLSDECVFADWCMLKAMPCLADMAIVTLQDGLHYEAALTLIEKGYHLLLEKPMAVTPAQCKAITEAAEKRGVKVVVCHVLRFTDFWRGIKQVLDDGKLGEPLSIIHMENVGNIHHSHSYVRGNWRNSKEATPMILAKSCHDMDILQWLLGKECTRVQSFGALTHFTAKNRPAGAPDRCLDGCPMEETCLYHAKRVYMENLEDSFIQALRRIIVNTAESPDDEAVMDALQNGPYGRCVYACDNDVVDHQVVNLEFEGGCTVSFTMNAFNEGGRFIRIFGTKGELLGDMGECTLKLYSFADQSWTTIDLKKIGQGIESGHGGGDTGIMQDVLCLLRGEAHSDSICQVRTSYQNHLIAFAAEQSRLDGTVIRMQDYEKTL